MKKNPATASLYVHVPFCSGKKCDYCDFYSLPLDPEADFRPELFIETLLSEGERLFEEYRPVLIPTVYIGGGTPSVLGAAGICTLLRGLSELISRYSCAPQEITIEANPESADEAFLVAARDGGATRLSLGVQTFHAPSRWAVNRIGDESLLPERLALAAAYFPGAFSVDLISGFPRQDEKVLLDDIKRSLAFSPAHVSLYALGIEAGTPLARREKCYIPKQDEIDRLWLSGRNALEKAGYKQYEVSNFCLPGKESRHNIRYWRMLSWLAIGPSASGTIIDDETGTGYRYTFREYYHAEACHPAMPDSLRRKGAEERREEERREEDERGEDERGEEFLDSFTLMKETLLMGFRYIEGPDDDLFRKRFHRNIEECIPKTINTWRGRGLLQSDKNALTKEGLLFLNRFLIDAFEELDSKFIP